jgi:hypothetical protein
VRRLAVVVPSDVYDIVHLFPEIRAPSCLNGIDRFAFAVLTASSCIRSRSTKIHSITLSIAYVRYQSYVRYRTERLAGWSEDAPLLDFQKNKAGR